MTMEDKAAAEATVEDHIRSAVSMMVRGACMSLDNIPDDITRASSHYGPSVTAEIAKRLSAAPVAVKVRELEFTKDQNGDFHASTIVGNYLIAAPRAPTHRWKLYRYAGEQFPSSYRDFESAHEAANTDFANRILSALSPAPVSAEPQPVADSIIAWYGTNGAEWCRADGKSAACMTKPVMYAPIDTSLTNLAAEIVRLREALKNAPDQKHFDILVEAMAEVKATNDGLSDQTITEIVDGCLAEIAALADQKGGAA